MQNRKSHTRYVTFFVNRKFEKMWDYICDTNFNERNDEKFYSKNVLFRKNGYAQVMMGLIIMVPVM